MSAQSPMKNAAKPKAFTAQNLTEGKNREGLSSEVLHSLIEEVQIGDRGPKN